MYEHAGGSSYHNDTGGKDIDNITHITKYKGVRA